jgi:hypothetical protein
MSAASCPARGAKVAHLYDPDLMIEVTATAEIPREWFCEPWPNSSLTLEDEWRC